MNDYKESSEAVDVLIKLIMLGTVTGVMLAAPNAVQILDKPLNKIFDKLDDREKKRKLSQLKSYLRTRGLVRGEYEHGIQLTAKAKKRLLIAEFRNLAIPVPEKWDGCWRLVMFDIPERKRDARIALTSKMQTLDFQILQQSVWIHPFPCRDAVTAIVAKYDVSEWVTYLETSHIENDHRLKKRFSRLL